MECCVLKALLFFFSFNFYLELSKIPKFDGNNDQIVPDFVRYT